MLVDIQSHAMHDFVLSGTTVGRYCTTEVFITIIDIIAILCAHQKRSVIFMCIILLCPVLLYPSHKHSLNRDRIFFFAFVTRLYANGIPFCKQYIMIHHELNISWCVNPSSVWLSSHAFITISTIHWNIAQLYLTLCKMNPYGTYIGSGFLSL